MTPGRHHNVNDPNRKLLGPVDANQGNTYRSIRACMNKPIEPGGLTYHELEVLSDMLREIECRKGRHDARR